MKTVVTIDFDIIMAPSIELYDSYVPAMKWKDLIPNPYYQVLRPDAIHYHRIIQYLLRCMHTLSKDQIHFVSNHVLTTKYINEPVNLYNIDHHHDCGYGDVSMPLSSNWVWFLDQQHLLKSYTWIKNHSSLPILDSLEYTIPKEEYFDIINIETLPIPDELIIAFSEPWIPTYYHSLFFALMDICSDKYNQAQFNLEIE